MKELYLETQVGQVYYQYENEANENDVAIFWLHGWGTSSESFYNAKLYIKEYKMVFIDFLGFGKSSDPIRPLTLDDYVIVLREIVKRMNCKNVILIGHSFGGRVAIRYASLYNISKLFLISAKVQKSTGFKYRFSIYKYKLLKLIYYLFNRRKYCFLITNSGSNDYKNANSIMKKTLKKIVNNDLVRYLKNIKSRTIVIGSVNDKVVDYKETLLIYNNINNSKLYPFYESNHFCFQTEERKFYKIIRKELKEYK